MTNGNGNASRQIVGALAGTGVLGVLAAGMLAVANDARVSLDVARQHGEEILMMRGELAAIRAEISDRTVDRYTSRDHAQYDRYINERLDRLEKVCKVD